MEFYDYMKSKETCRTSLILELIRLVLMSTEKPLKLDL